MVSYFFEGLFPDKGMPWKGKLPRAVSCPGTGGRKMASGVVACEERKTAPRESGRAVCKPPRVRAGRHGCNICVLYIL